MIGLSTFWHRRIMSFWPRRKMFFGFASNNSTDQPLHPRSLFSAFVISVLENTISKLAKNEFTLFYLVYVAE